MKLSSEAIDLILAVVAQFDRERGIPHDYLDLETKLKSLRCTERENGTIDVEVPSKGEGHEPKVVTLDPKSLLIGATTA